MTAEIAIMNKEAIALAADSAITMTGSTGQKISTSGNKLFVLSKYHPVGIMIYGAALFMEVPWETIIKVYRKNLGKRKCNTLKEYSKDFINFLNNGNPLFPASIQKQFLIRDIYSYFNLIKNHIEEKAKKLMDEQGEITAKEIRKIVLEEINEHYEKWEKVANIPSIPKNFNKNLVRKYGENISKITKDVFEKLPISKSSSNKLKKIVAGLFSKFPEDIHKDVFSGVVIAGFGDKEIFPSLEAFHLEIIVNNKLK